MIKYLAGLSIASWLSLGGVYYYHNSVEKELKNFYDSNTPIYKNLKFKNTLEDCIKNIELAVNSEKNGSDPIQCLNTTDSAINEAFLDGVFTLEDHDRFEKLTKSLFNSRIIIIDNKKRGKTDKDYERKSLEESIEIAVDLKKHYLIKVLSDPKSKEYFVYGAKLKKGKSSMLLYFILGSTSTFVTIFGSIYEAYKKLTSKIIDDELE